ncbi:hypothetical protein RJ639_037332 [Escallonia herrerae]|uniref:Reverse transcriptase RNase H-like domain-containing protein n=1 Tax=Escallonia herrerae TaxID=1293975 RepID=A0AA88WTL6_9ASTE|nr:hypothetical protein RJ639_037332 [Escallonia herrerae]
MFLYLSITEVAVSAILVREEDGVQKTIYYVSYVLQDVETRYPKIDKIALAIIISARHLRPFFQSHTIVILTDQPLRKVLLGPEASGRLTVLQPLVAVEHESFSSAQKVSWLSMPSTLDSRPQTMKQNERPFLARIRLAHALKVDSLSVHSDSLLVVNHVLGDYEARDERMAQYLQLVKTLASKFTSVDHPQSNGQAENINRSILQGLKKRLDEAKGAWVDELPKVLWAYRTTPYSVIGETPFLLCYGTEAMLPVEIRFPTIRALHFNEEHNEFELRAILDLVEEARTQAYE